MPFTNCCTRILNVPRLRSLKPAEGYGSYRTITAFMDKVADKYGPVQGSINRRLKKALDPNGILASGKSGIR